MPDRNAPIATARKRLGLTQAQLADECGVTWRTVQRWEAGEHPVPKLAREKIERMLEEAGEQKDDE